MSHNEQYDYDWSPSGPLAPLHERAAHPGQTANISPPVGWLNLVLGLNDALAILLPDYTIAQIKEKFAALRYYIESWGVSSDDPRIALAHELIAEAEKESQRICQVCGQPGKFSDNSYPYATLCSEHSAHLGQLEFELPA